MEKNLSPVDGSPAQALLTELTRQCQPKCLLWRKVGLARTGEPIITIAGRPSSQANYSQS